MAQSEKHYDFAIRKIYVFFAWLKVHILKDIFITMHYVRRVGGLKMINALRMHYEGKWVGHIDRNEHCVVYGQPLFYFNL